MQKKKRNDKKLNENKKSEKQQVLVVPASTTMSSISEPTASVSFLPSIPPTNTKENADEEMLSFRDVQLLLKEIKTANGTRKEKSTSEEKPKKANEKDIPSSITSYNRRFRDGEKEKLRIKDIENWEEESLDSVYIDDSVGDKENDTTIDRLKLERKFYRSEAKTLRSELGNIKEELSELRKFLQRLPNNKDENHEPSEGHQVQHESDAASSMTLKSFDTIYTEQSDLFSNLEDAKNKVLRTKQQRERNSTKLERPVPLYAANLAQSLPRDILSVKRDTNNNSDIRSGSDYQEQRTSPKVRRELRSSERFYAMISSPAPKVIVENQRVGTGQRASNNSQRNITICNSEHKNDPKEKGEQVAVKNVSPYRTRSYRSRSMSPMSRRNKLNPPSPSVGKTRGDNRKSERSVSRPGHSHEAALKDEMKDKERLVMQNDGVVNSRRSINHAPEEKNSGMEFNYDDAKNFYRSYQPSSEPDAAKELGNISSKTESSQSDSLPNGRNATSFTFNEPKSPELDLKAADRKYREMRRSIQSMQQVGSNNVGHHLPECESEDSDSFLGYCTTDDSQSENDDSSRLSFQHQRPISRNFSLKKMCDEEEESSDSILLRPPLPPSR